MNQEPILSVIIPVYNEEVTLPLLKSRIATLPELSQNTEILLIDDGSHDNTRQLIIDWAHETPMVKGIFFSRNFGQQAAISAGLDYAKGDYVGIMDADLQDPPEELLIMFNKAKNTNADIVYGVRRTRKEGFIKRLGYKFFYTMYSFFSDFPVHEHSGDFCIINKKAVNTFRNMPEKIRFNRGLRSWIGFRSIPHEIDRPGRESGKSKYPFRKLVLLAFEGIVSTSTKPLRLSFILGILMSISALALGSIYLFLYFTTDVSRETPGFVSIITLILFLSGVQFFLIGILGEYIATIFKEVKRRPQYIIDYTT